MKKFWITFIFYGMLPTAIAFLLHPVFCKYEMNLLCFIKCCFPLIGGLSVAIFYYDENE